MLLWTSHVALLSALLHHSSEDRMHDYLASYWGILLRSEGLVVPANIRPMSGVRSMMQVR